MNCGLDGCFREKDHWVNGHTSDKMLPPLKSVSFQRDTVKLTFSLSCVAIWLRKARGFGIGDFMAPRNSM